ncbi:hypothetical protein Pint_04651 [Pistacia integerrima]|uniref:Uncharacterized protein n=1 Tax=Pistacia integerrima TaxID=434235 RepID=A0ACC0Z8J4_9ROSI|nr:hypothetical protein Pint_04651 [Pistacia integerrima]
MDTSKLHVAMFPWLAFGHFIPYLRLSNKLAERGHKVSYLLAKGALPKLQQLNHHPDLIHFFPLVIPHVDGLPSGAETASDVPFPLHDLLISAMDNTKDQVETILTNLKPDIVFFDFGQWIPSITRQLGTKGSLYGRLTGSMKESDAIAVRTCHEIEGSFCDYLAQQYSKPVLLTGPVLPETPDAQLEEKWDKWLYKFDPGSVVYCAFGSQITLQKEQFQEMMLGFELSGFPFLVALTPPHGCSTIGEALPEGFKGRIGERGWVHGGWVPQTLILKHPSVGYGCKINGRRIEAIEVGRGLDGMIGKEGLSKAIKSVMDNESELGNSVKNNHVKWKNIFSGKNWQDEKIDGFVQDLQFLLESGK